MEHIYGNGVCIYIYQKLKDLYVAVVTITVTEYMTYKITAPKKVTH